MNFDIAKMLVEAAVLVGIAVVGSLVKRAAKGIDDKLGSIDTKLDKNIAITNSHAQDLAVVKFRLAAIDGKSME